MDGTDLEYLSHMKIVDQILDDIEAYKPKRLLVLNKIDQIHPLLAKAITKKLGAVVVLTKTKASFGELLKSCEEALFETKKSPKN